MQTIHSEMCKENLYKKFIFIINAYSYMHYLLNKCICIQTIYIVLNFNRKFNINCCLMTHFGSTNTNAYEIYIVIHTYDVHIKYTHFNEF